MKAKDIIAELRLEPLTIEGGHFLETYRSTIPAGTNTGHCAGTCIYYLLRGTEKSQWHQVANDEIWLYHAGCPAIQLLVYPDGKWEERLIGADLIAGERPQSLIPAGTWQAAVLTDNQQKSWGLFGAVVIPGFEYDDFTLASGNELLAEYQVESLARRMTELDLR